MIWIVKTLVRSCRIPGYRSGQSTRLSQPRLHLVGHTHRALLARQPTGQRLWSRTHRSLHECSVCTLWHSALARRGRHFPGHLRNEPTGAVDLRRLACPFTGGSHRVRHLYARVHPASLGFVLALGSLVVSFLVTGIMLRRISRWRGFVNGLVLASPLTLVLFVLFFATFKPAASGAGLGVAGLTQRVLIVEVHAWFVALADWSSCLLR